MAAEPYDVKFTISGGSEYGFMLVSPPDASKQLEIGEVDGPDGQYELNRIANPEVRTHTDFDMKNDTVMAQSDLSGGLGYQDYHEDNDKVWWAPGVVLHVPGKTYLAPPVNTESFPSGAAEWAGSTSFLTSGGTRYDFAWQSTRLYRRDASNTTNNWLLMYTAGAAITDVEIVDGAALICVPSLGGTTDFFSQADPTAAATWTPTARLYATFDTTVGKPKFFARVKGTTYAAVDSNKVFFSTDPSTDSFAGPINTALEGNTSGPPGDTSHAFQQLVPVNNYLFAFKRDAGYSVDSQQEVEEVIWQWRDKPSTSNFAYMATAGSGGDTLYYSVSPEVYAYDGGTGRNLPMGLSRLSGVSVEDVVGVGADNQYVYVLAKVYVPRIRSAASMALLRGWRYTQTTWGWECLWEDTAATTYSGLYVSPQGQGSRVYWFKTDGTASLHMDIAADWDETTSGSFATSGILYTSLWKTGWPNLIKRWLWNAVATEAMSASSTITVAYSTDAGSTWTNLGSAITSSGLTFAAFSEVNTYSIMLRFTFASAGTATPVLRVFDLHGRVRWRHLRRGSAAVRIANRLELSNGGRDEATTAATLVANLNAIRRSDGTILYEDFLGHSFNVSIDSIQFRPTRHEKPENSYEVEAQIGFSEASSGS